MREWETCSRFPCTADEYYAIMEDGEFQEKLHLEGLGMGCWDYTDTRHDDGTMKRVVFSEPHLNLPAVIARMMSRAQAYHEYTTFTPSERRRVVRVVPCVGGENMDLTFDERVLPDDEDDGVGGGGGCVVEAQVMVNVGVLKKGSTTERKSNWLCRLLERFICSTSKLKIAERDAWLNRHFQSLGYRVCGGDVTKTSTTTAGSRQQQQQQLDETCFDDDEEEEEEEEEEAAAMVVEVTLVDGGDDGKAAKKSKSVAEAVAAAEAAAAKSKLKSLSALGSHPLPPSTFRRSTWKALKSSVATAVY